jgi:lipoate-protein ligase A
MRVDVTVTRHATPGRAFAWERAALAAAASGRAALHVYEMDADVVALGRYHVAPDERADGAFWRRQSGGRATAAGAGFVVVAFALPHRSALVSTDPFALGPEQVMNRCVRGLLRALALAGVDARYPGRDTVTAGGRPLALVSFEVDRRGALLFEAVMSVGRDASALPAMLDRADPAGVVPAAMVAADAVTSVDRETGRVPGVEDVVAWIRRGYAESSDVAFGDGPPATLADEPDVRGWLHARRPPASARRARTSTLLGTLEAFVARDGDAILDVCLAGDLIAPSPTVAAIEAGLRGCHAERSAVDAVVTGVLADPGAFVLGVGPARTLTDTIMEAAVG